MPLRSVVDPAECRLNRRNLDPVAPVRLRLVQRVGGGDGQEQADAEAA
jgi:hypothetical protein